MWEGWNLDRVNERHLRYARELVDAGVTWDRAAADDWPMVTDMVRDHIIAGDRFVVGPGDSALLARDVDGNTVGAIVVATEREGHRIVLAVRHLVVEPVWRGRGVGAVSLGLFAQMVGEEAGQVVLTYGACGVGKAARFYQHAGFTVLAPGQPLKHPFSGQAMIVNNNEHYPCWFYRTW